MAIARANYSDFHNIFTLFFNMNNKKHSTHPTDALIITISFRNILLFFVCALERAMPCHLNMSYFFFILLLYYYSFCNNI